MRMTEEEYAELLKKTGKMQPKPKPKKVSKYRNKKVRVGNVPFDSQKEADFYSLLKWLHKAGEIAGYCLQPTFVLLEGDIEKGVLPETYKADFIIFNNDGTYEIVDVKGFETEVFRIKNKQFMDKYPELELRIEKGGL